MAYRLLVDQPKTLHLLRSKLKHIIVDEYQDMSVSQHSLLRLVVRGIIYDDEGPMPHALRKKRKVEQRRRRKLPVLLEPSDYHKRRFKASSPRSNIHSKSLSVPNIFCAGDASQSIYGWRGGAPELTVHGFRRDYPQGVIAPLSTCYRLPNDIVEAAAMLLPRESIGDRGEDIWDDAEVSDSYDVSPAAASKLASSLTRDSPDLTVDRRGRNHHSGKVILSSEEHVRLGNRLLLSKAMKKIDSTVILHGLWDAREEAKYIASTIRRRSKDRRVALLSALSEIDTDVLPPEKEFLDSTEVAVMARTSSKLHLVKEALANAGIPFVTHENKEADTLTKDEDDAQNWLSKKRSGSVKTLPIKPVTVATMHRSKGEEFDDVYLAGWTEGEFPHPDAVSSNRVHEERRLAYVALTRARQRVVITHSFMTRVLHYGKNGMKKYVTSQVEPSRFLYELVPSKQREDGIYDGDDDVPWLPDNKGTEWRRTSGVKEYVVGRNVPHFFQKAYQMPKGYVAKRSALRQVSAVHMAQTTKAIDAQLPSAISKRDEQIVSKKSPLEVVEDGLKDIVVLRKKGANKKLRPVFKKMLSSFFQIQRGNALVFASGVKSKQTQNGSVYALVEASSDELEKKPLAKCTATQLGHYFGLLWSKREGTTTLERSSEDGETSWADLTIKQLKPELRKRGLKLSGRKDELIKRLEDYDDQVKLPSSDPLSVSS